MSFIQSWQMTAQFNLLKFYESHFGLTQEILHRLGGFIVAWGLFENQLEPMTLVALGEKIQKGRRPVTDCLQPSDLLMRFRKGVQIFLPETIDAAEILADTAEDLLVFRNAITHGRALPPPAGGPKFLNNAAWLGEGRKRPPTEAHISDHLLDMAIECAGILTLQGVCLQMAMLESEENQRAIAKETIAHLRKARSMANELRHLSALMNDEHY